MSTRYTEGDIPLKELSIQVRHGDGSACDLTGLSVSTFMMDTDNKEADLRGAYVNVIAPSQGMVLFSFPEDRSLFPKHGEYLLALVISKGKRREFTNYHTIKVRRLGEVYR